MIGKGIISILDGNSAYKTAIGTKQSANAAKVFPDVATQGTLKPYSIYRIVSEVPEHNKDERGVGFGSFDLEHFATTQKEAIDLQELAILALDHYKGTANGVSINSIRLIDKGTAFKYDTNSYKVSSEYSYRIN